MGNYYLIMDIGGTKTTGALFSEDGRIVDDYTCLVKSQTFKGEEAVYQNTKGVLLQVLDHFGVSLDDVLGIGVGSPGPLNTKEGIIVHAPLMGWKNFPIVQRLKEDFHKPVMLDNDGNLGALAEQRSGLAKGYQNVMYMTVSTGCGGGIVINGQIYHGKNDGAGEVGHMCIDTEGRQCPCGAKGCFELYASGTAINRQMKDDMRAGKQSLVFELADHKEENLEGRLLSEAASKGDAYALALYRQEGYYLGVGIANLFNLFDPEIFVLGGGVIKAREFFHEELLRAFQERCIQKVSTEQIKYSVMNDRVVLYGAYHLIHDYITKATDQS